MTGGRTPDSLFSRLLGTRASRTSKDGVKGHEEYLTQIMAFLLQQDSGLTARWLKAWFDLAPVGPVEVVAEDNSDSASHPGSKGGASTIDLRVSFADDTGQSHRVYVENKVEAKLNQYACMSGDTIDQVEKYTRLLDAVCAHSGEAGHIVVCSLWPLNDRPPQLTERVSWHPPRVWADFYTVVSDHVTEGASASPEAAWLQHQFLTFCKAHRLDPTKPLRPGHDSEHARRILADASRQVGGLDNPRVAGSLLFGNEEGQWSVGFQADGLSVYKTGDGARVVPALDDDFWTADAKEQARQLAERIRNVAELKPADTARTPLGETLGRFKNHEPLAAFITEDLRARWGVEPSTGANKSEVAEIAFRHPEGRSIRLGPYKDNRLILVPRCDTSGLRDAIVAALGRSTGITALQTQVNVLLRFLSFDTWPAVLAAFEKHDAAGRDDKVQPGGEQSP